MTVSTSRASRSRTANGVFDEAATADVLFRLVAAVVLHRDRDVSLTMVSTLGLLEQKGPCRVTELATIEDVAQPSMTALVNRLERLGLVDRHRHPGDQRVVLVSLRPAGADYLRSFGAVHVRALVPLLAELSAEETAALVAATPALQHLSELVERERITARTNLPMDPAPMTRRAHGGKETGHGLSGR